MKKILHISHTDINFDSRIKKEIDALTKFGYDVYGIGIKSNNEPNSWDNKIPSKIYSISLNSKKLKFLPNRLRHILSIIELLISVVPRAVRINADVIHCHDTLALPLGVLTKIFTKSKIVYDAHELESDRNGISALLAWITLKVEKLLWPFVDSLIVVSPSIKNWYSENLGYKNTTVILNSPHFVQSPNLESNYLRKKYSIPCGVPIFVYVGVLGAGRGIDLITSAFVSKKVNSHVVFLGYGELMAQLKTMSMQFANIHVHEQVPHEQVVPVIKSADYGLCLIQNVSLSDYYCLPNKLFEYCFAGLPVLASDFPDIRQIIYDFNLGEVCELNVESILNGIAMLELNDRVRVMGDLQSLSWAAQENKLSDVYKSLFA